MDIQQNIPLAPYTTVKIGGPADFFIHTKNSSEFIEAIKYGQKNNLPITVLGNCSSDLS
jgi:UDP-N-acetylmuramate dehydrogenase